MDKRGKTKLFITVFAVLLVSMFLTNFVISNSHNTKEYDSINKIVTIKNPSGNIISDITLNTPQVFNVIRGKDRKVAEFTINNKLSSQQISSVLEKLNFYNINNGMQKFDRQFTYKYKNSFGFETVNDYGTVCVNGEKLGNGTTLQDCNQVLTGTHQEEMFEWVDLNSLGEIPSGKTTIGIFTDVLPNERVEWIPTMFGVEVSEWAEWTESFNTNLVVYYTLNGTSGDVVDSLGNEPGTNGGATRGITGIINNSFDFESSEGDFANLTSTDKISGVDEFSISLWVKPESFPGVGDFVDQEVNFDIEAAFLVRVFPTSGIVDFVIWNEGGTASQINNFVIVTNEWSHIVATYDGSATRLYINNSLSASGTLTGNVRNSPQNITIGARADNSNFYDGLIDEIAIWNRSLNASEISDLYNNGAGITYTNVFNIAPTTTLNSPADNANFATSSVTFSIIPQDAEDATGLNVSLYHNHTTWGINQTNSSAVNNSQTNFTTSFPDGIYVWNGLTTDTEGSSAFATSNRTFTVDTTPPQTTTIAISPSNPTTSDDLDCNAILTDNLQTSLTANWTWYKNNITNLTGVKIGISNNTNTIITTLLSGNTTKGEEWKCGVIPYDDLNYGSESNSSSVMIVNSITFNVTDSFSSVSLNFVTISCNSTSFSQGGDTTNTYGPYGFADGSYSCTFVRDGSFDKTIIFSADDDKVVNVKMPERAGLSIEEHTWLEKLHDCLINEQCTAFDLWKSTNQTTQDIWKKVTRTDRSVITFENITNDVLGPNQDIIIDYAINIPFKAGYNDGELLPLRMFFWFHDGTTCFNQDKRTKSNSAESPFCFPLVAETLGPNNGSVNFTVTLSPDIPSGTYTTANITRTIEIDPIVDGEVTWTNYGQEVIGQITVLESGDATIKLENTGEKGILQNIASGITGAVTGAVSGVTQYLLSGWQIVAIVAIIGGVLVVFIISRTKIKLRKK